jgi:hypothetical protein
MEVLHVQPVHLRHQYTTSVELLEKVQCFLYCQIQWTTPSATFSKELVNTVPEVSTIYLLYQKDISWYTPHKKTLDPKNSNPKDNTQILDPKNTMCNFPCNFSKEIVNTVPEVPTIYLLHLKDISWYASHKKTLNPKQKILKSPKCTLWIARYSYWESIQPQ